MSVDAEKVLFIRTVRRVLEGNVSTIEKIGFKFTLDKSVIEECFDESEKKFECSLSDEFIEGIKQIIDILKNRDQIIQNCMQIMEERFEKVWRLPWVLMQIIHGYTWNRKDLRNISSKASIFSLQQNTSHFAPLTKTSQSLNKTTLAKSNTIKLDMTLYHLQTVNVRRALALSKDFPRVKCGIHGKRWEPGEIE